MALGWLALVAQQRARLFRRQLPHLPGLDDRLGEIELPGVDPLEVLVPPGPSRRSPIGVPKALRWTYSMLTSASAFFNGFLEKPGLREFGTARTSITRSTPAFCKAARNSAMVVAS